MFHNLENLFQRSIIIYQFYYISLAPQESNKDIYLLQFSIAYLIERVPRDVRSDVVRAKVPDESHHARGVADRDILGLP